MSRLINDQDTDEKEGHHKLPRRLRVSRGITLLYPTGNTHPDATYRQREMFLPRKLGLKFIRV